MGSIKQENPLITEQIKGKVKDIQFLQVNSDEKDWLIFKVLLSTYLKHFLGCMTY